AIRTDLTKEVMVRKELRRTLKILNETGHIAKVGGWELEVATGKLTWTDETFRILEVEKRENQSPILPEGLELFVDEHKPIIEKAVGDAINEGRPYALELQAQTAKGNIRWVYTNGKANYKDGKIVTLSGTIQDIDEQKKAEQRYELERQKSIQNAKLASLGELAASVAHEINNPLSIVYGAAQMLEEEDLSEFQERYARSIIGSCERISHIIKSLQKFSRLDVEEETAVFDFSDLIRESISLVSVRARQEDVSIEFECDADAPKVLCQEVQVEQVFVNLFNNAMDAIADLPARWIKIKLQDGADHWLVKITDCGSGIDPEFAKRIFEPFVTTKAVGKGTGLGLSITAGILKDHKAGIRLDAECPNTTFVITFPKAKNGS
ncbi:MAG: histidine kinase dimerization/phospho-acceptor domain-containing protein, partial [Alphaproteobacteria bacterium]|nr:histidine kinase dimerization/phospho-acceptor domain-containing protein [Alphaproteobacteria bacterium]